MLRRSPPSDPLGADDTGDSEARRAAHPPGDHWKRLLRAPKAPLPVSVGEFVDELNRRLRADPCYRQGTRFIVASADDTRPGGSTWEGPDAMKPVVCRIVHETVGEFDVALPFFSDR